MENFALPRWFLRAKYQPQGQRLKKMEAFHTKPESHYRPKSTLTYLPPITPNLFGSGASKLDGTEYRYWAAAPLEDNKPNGIMVFECRACGDMVTTKDERITHQEKHGCPRKLVDAYKLLLKDNMCVVCDTKTTNTKWGVPICKGACITKWCEELAQPRALKDALALMEYQNASTKRI